MTLTFFIPLGLCRQKLLFYYKLDKSPKANCTMLLKITDSSLLLRTIHDPTLELEISGATIWYDLYKTDHTHVKNGRFKNDAGPAWRRFINKYKLLECLTRIQQPKLDI